MISRCNKKDEMLKHALGYLTSNYKIKTIYRLRVEKKDRHLKADELFYWEKQQAEYLYQFSISKIAYKNLLNSEFIRGSFSFCVNAQQQ